MLGKRSPHENTKGPRPAKVPPPVLPVSRLLDTIPSRFNMTRTYENLTQDTCASQWNKVEEFAQSYPNSWHDSIFSDCQDDSQKTDAAHQKFTLKHSITPPNTSVTINGAIIGCESLIQGLFSMDISKNQSQVIPNCLDAILVDFASVHSHLRLLYGGTIILCNGEEADLIKFHLSRRYPSYSIQTAVESSGVEGLLLLLSSDIIIMEFETFGDPHAERFGPLRSKYAKGSGTRLTEIYEISALEFLCERKDSQTIIQLLHCRTCIASSRRPLSLWLSGCDMFASQMVIMWETQNTPNHDIAHFEDMSAAVWYADSLETEAEIIRDNELSKKLRDYIIEHHYLSVQGFRPMTIHGVSRSIVELKLSPEESDLLVFSQRISETLETPETSFERVYQHFQNLSPDCYFKQEGLFESAVWKMLSLIRGILSEFEQLEYPADAFFSEIAAQTKFIEDHFKTGCYHQKSGKFDGSGAESQNLLGLSHPDGNLLPGSWVLSAGGIWIDEAGKFSIDPRVLFVLPSELIVPPSEISDFASRYLGQAVDGLLRSATLKLSSEFFYMLMGRKILGKLRKCITYLISHPFFESEKVLALMVRVLETEDDVDCSSKRFERPESMATLLILCCYKICALDLLGNELRGLLKDFQAVKQSVRSSLQNYRDSAKCDQCSTLLAGLTFTHAVCGHLICRECAFGNYESKQTICVRCTCSRAYFTLPHDYCIGVVEKRSDLVRKLIEPSARAFGQNRCNSIIAPTFTNLATPHWMALVHLRLLLQPFKRITVYAGKCDYPRELLNRHLEAVYGKIHHGCPWNNVEEYRANRTRMKFLSVHSSTGEDEGDEINFGVSMLTDRRRSLKGSISQCNNPQSYHCKSDMTGHVFEVNWERPSRLKFGRIGKQRGTDDVVILFPDITDEEADRISATTRADHGCEVVIIHLKYPQPAPQDDAI